MIQFLFNEDVTPALRAAANARGYHAHHVQYIGWKGRTDVQILQRMMDQDLTLVTGNWKDFRALLARREVHPGVISLPDVPRAEQVRLFNAAIDVIEAATPPMDMVNTCLLVRESGEIEVMQFP